MIALTRILGIAAMLVVVALPQMAVAGQPEVYRGAIRGVAINGYDPVAYFTENRPVEGREAITTEWKGVTWRFSSEANRDAFAANPEKYAPQYGGYCAFAVANGSTASSDPGAFTIVNDRLYLNVSAAVRDFWAKDTAGNISKADANWPNVLK
jgi:YHS domain-containing protein